MASSDGSGDELHEPRPCSGGSALIAWAMRQVALWGGLVIAVYLAIGYRSLWLPAVLAPALRPITAASAPAPQQHAAPINTLVYRANPQGHVLLEAVVNGVPIRFMLDTGATAVALTARDAAAAGIARHQLDF